MKLRHIFCGVLLMILTGRVSSILEATPPSSPSTEDSQNTKTASKSGKTQIYMGDPALKRGFELGYDDGVKAGKYDKKVGRKADPNQHENYRSAGKKHRSEYGNYARFTAGYQGGFVKGYKSGYSREKTDPVAAAEEKKKPPPARFSTETKSTLGVKSGEPSLSTSKPKTRVFNPAEDAL